MGKKYAPRFKGQIAKSSTFRLYEWEKPLVREFILKDRYKRAEIVNKKGEEIIKTWIEK